MRISYLRAPLCLVVAAAAVLIAGGATAQEGHPLAGTWYGDYTAGQQTTDITVIMKWDGKSLTGMINPGPNSKPLTSAVMDITPGKPAPQGQQSTSVGGVSFPGQNTLAVCRSTRAGAAPRRVLPCSTIEAKPRAS